MENAAVSFYHLVERPLTKWGDYGNILQHGMTAHRGRIGGLLPLERTGPYLPPITFPGIRDVVLSSAGKGLLEASGLTGFSFQPVHKAGIVELRWEEWDLAAAEPPEYPDSGEPEDYILDRRASARMAEQIGDVWELMVPSTTSVKGRPKMPMDLHAPFRDQYIERNSWNGADVFGVGFGLAFVTERAKAWFEAHLGKYVAFERIDSR
jgi:hypothetical protein